MTSPIRPATHDDGPTRTASKAELLNLAKRAGVVWAVGALILLLAVGVGYAFDVLLLAFAGALVAILLRSVSDFLSAHTGIGEKWSLAATVLLLMTLVGLGLWLLIPRIAAQTDELLRVLPRSVEHLESQVTRYEWGRWLLEQATEPAALAPSPRFLLTRLTGVVSGALGAVGIAVLVFFIGLLLALQPRLHVEGIVSLVSIRKRNRARAILVRIGTELRRWLLVKLVAMVFVGAMTWLGLWLLGIDISLTLAVIAALLTLIPNLGPILATVPAALIGLLDGPATAGWVIALYVAIQIVESYLVTPLLEQKAVALPPALTLTAQLVMAAFAGIVGLALAAPLTVVALVLVRTLYVEEILGDRA